MAYELFSPHDPLSDDFSALKALQSLVTRMDLWPQLIRRSQEEQITELVPFDRDFVDKELSNFLDGRPIDKVLDELNLTKEELLTNLKRSEALRRFANYLFGPGLEELFLSARGKHDQVIYSILRVRDPGLAQELWIRIAEGEGSFAELASQYGEGPEAAKKGIMGPVAFGNILPIELANLIRTLKVGDVNSPVSLGEWRVLLRLEQLTPARFDATMHQFLLDQQINAFLDARVQKILIGQTVDPLEFESST